eukprot:gb/GEZN01003294.1/.p1 GENE.gb/GEZN01003294.1/~~gb/GEZN01003294.1/.p1  ORF type:complete len:530 (+),score=43.65 gb/GEZN01003294.1/:321-1910(+)
MSQTKISRYFKNPKPDSANEGIATESIVKPGKTKNKEMRPGLPSGVNNAPFKKLNQTVKILLSTAHVDWAMSLPLLLHTLSQLRSMPYLVEECSYDSLLLEAESQAVKWLLETLRSITTSRSERSRSKKATISSLLHFLCCLVAMDSMSHGSCQTLLPLLQQYRELLSVAFCDQVILFGGLSSWSDLLGRVISLMYEGTGDFKALCNFAVGAEEDNTSSKLVLGWREEYLNLLKIAFRGLEQVRSHAVHLCNQRAQVCDISSSVSSRLLRALSALVNTVLLDMWVRCDIQQLYAQALWRLLEFPSTTTTLFMCNQNCAESIEDRVVQAFGAVIGQLLTDSVARHPQTMRLEIVQWILFRVALRQVARLPLALCSKLGDAGTVSPAVANAHLDRISMILSDIFKQKYEEPVADAIEREIDAKQERIFRKRPKQASLISVMTDEGLARAKRLREVDKAAEKKRLQLDHELRERDVLRMKTESRAQHRARQMLTLFLGRYWLQVLRPCLQEEGALQRWSELWALLLSGLQVF